jgi:ATP-binding cassette subfamily B protein/ATP-binding cassette subfamily C protein
MMKLPLKQFWVLLRKYLTPQLNRVVLMALLLFTHIGLQLVNPQILRYFIDTASVNGPMSALINAALIFIGIAVVGQGLSIVNRYLSEHVAWTATNLLRLDLTAHCFRLDQSFHKTHTTGELIERIDGDVNALSNFFSQFVIYVLANLLLMIGILVLLFREDWRIGLALSFFAGLALVIVLRVRTIARAADRHVVVRLLVAGGDVLRARRRHLVFHQVRIRLVLAEPVAVLA